MEEVFIAIMEQIAQEMPELSLIDEDYGQLEMGAEEDQYPVTFPCVLIGNTSSDWNDLGYGVQKSESMLTVRLAIDCYDDTSYASGTYDKVRERQQLAGKLYKSLQCLQCTDNASPLVREKSRSYAMPHYIKVYEMTFSFTLHDESAMPSSSGVLPSIAMSVTFPIEVIVPQTSLDLQRVFGVVRAVLAFKNRYTIHLGLNPRLTVQFNKVTRLHGQ